MQNKQESAGASREENKLANTGNASNPLPTDLQTNNTNQLLDKKAEKYLRESGNVEDMPDAEDEQEMNDDRENK